MVEITILYDGENIVGFRGEGHSGYARRGRDIHCAGVSAITGTALIGLEKHLSREPIYEVRDGWLDCRLPQSLSEEDNKKAQLILSTMEAGLQSLQAANPKYIKVITGRC